MKAGTGELKTNEQYKQRNIRGRGEIELKLNSKHQQPKPGESDYQASMNHKTIILQPFEQQERGQNINRKNRTQPGFEQGNGGIE